MTPPKKQWCVTENKVFRSEFYPHIIYVVIISCLNVSILLTFVLSFPLCSHIYITRWQHCYCITAGTNVGWMVAEVNYGPIGPSLDLSHKTIIYKTTFCFLTAVCVCPQSKVL